MSKVLKLIKWQPYKIPLHNELSEEDSYRRIELGDIMMRIIDEDPLFLNIIVNGQDADIGVVKILTG